ncbi:MAG: hypothetical protein U1F68_12000 [Gammaproteobacteria bacterium]
MAGVEIVVNEAAGMCELTYARDALVISQRLQLPWPCQFHRDRKGKLRVVDAGGAKIVLLENTRPYPDFPNDCETRLQGVKIDARQVLASQRIQRVAKCPSAQWEEYQFTNLFY